LKPGGEALLWWKYLYWKQGIPTHLFNKEALKDIHDVIDVHNAISQKSDREKKINDMIRKVSMM